MAVQHKLVHTTPNGTQVWVRRGGISYYDFVVAYQRPGSPQYEPKHTDIVREIYQKLVRLPDATRLLIDHILEEFIRSDAGISRYPPSLQRFSPEHVGRFQALGLGEVGDYDVELLLVIVELVEIQEFTNRPGGWLPGQLFRTIRDDWQNVGEVGRLTVWVRGDPEEQRRLLAQRKEFIRELQEIMRG